MAKSGLVGGLLFLGTLLLMQAMAMGCDNTVCHVRGYRFGFALLVGCLLLALPGAVLLNRLSYRVGKAAGFGLFTSMTAGLVVLMVYVYVRSLFNQWVWDLPVSRWEIYGLVIGSGALGLQVLKQRWANSELHMQDLGGLASATVVLAAVCIVIADRELPRIVLLSSDPDFHVFFGLQVERFGGVPYHQHGWGEQAFNYPAASGVLLFIWRQITGLDMRNLLTALPILFSVVAGFVVVEPLMAGSEKTAHRLLLLLCALCMTVAGFLFPLFTQYAHMEGGARQMGILFAALFLGFVIISLRNGAKVPGKLLLLPLLTLFVLMVLNPAHVALPACLLLALGVHGLLTGRRSWSLLSVLVGGLALGLLDPFYQKLVGYTKAARTDTVIYADGMVVKSLPTIVHDTGALLANGYPAFFRQLAVLLNETQVGIFLILFLVYAACFVVLSRGPKISKAAAASVVALLASMYLIYAFTHAVETDIRTFLLAPYVFFNLTQYKALLLITMAALILTKMMEAQRPLIWLVLAVTVLSAPVGYLMRSSQPMVLDPRRGDCGALGCIEDEDQRLLRKFEAMTLNGEFRATSGAAPKVLIPNAVAKMDLETWIFPVTSARVLPFFRVLPAAFYYFQGDAEYSTASYKAHVCDRLDRAWLKSKGIEYLYLPSEREQSCVAGREALIDTEQVILNEGGAYLLKLR